ncbi:MAG TPA: hypothetical protein VJQ81_20095 [Reyranella sp.]|nr:hypothetical protein [Reyranella sp.]
MKTDDLDVMLADIIAEHFARLRVDIERMIDAKALPPFVPPHVWTKGRHAAGVVVRHRNGLFSARRDTDDEPPSDAWLPLLVGIASVALDWTDDRHLVLRVELSDGTTVETARDFVVPLARGYWTADAAYREGDRVIRFGDWQAAKPSTGIDPQGDANDGHWLKVNGKGGRVASFKLDDDGTMYESGSRIGTIKPLVANLLRDLVPA